MTFGESLRKEREQRGVTLEAISAATKVSVRHLAALERDEDRYLPGGVFNRGFVQNYCRHLGLDETVWVERYASEHASREQDWSGFAEAVKRGRAPEEPLMRRRWWGVFAMMLAMGVVAWAAWHFVVKPRVGTPAQSLPGTRASAAD